MLTNMLAPAAVLVLWSLVVLFWMVRTRYAALGTAKVDLKAARPGGRGQDLDGVLPDEVNWKAHNYTHLMEQPTLFYAVSVILALSGAGRIDVALAWAYVVIRIVHSAWQCTVNRIPVRVQLFGLSSLCLLILAIRAVAATLLP
ncbi:MAG: MAPEG family protein [Croceibacterium sp.]